MKLKTGAKIGLNREVDFFMLAVYWFFFGLLLRTAQPLSGVFLVWVFLASLFSIISLVAIGYFNHLIPKPELTDLMTLLLALPVSACFSKWLLVVITHISAIRYSQALIASFFVALLFEASQLIVFKIHRLMKRQWSLVTHLHPDELERLREQIEKSDSSWWIKLRPYERSHENGVQLRGDETLVISRRAVRFLKNHPELLTAHLRGQRIVDVGQLLKEFQGRVNLDNSDAWTFLLASTYQSFLIRLYFHIKELMEVIFAIILLVLLSPLLVALALCLLFTSGRPILYRQERLGYRGQKFSLYKFRTMPTTAEESGPQWARKDDPRVSGFARGLRKSRLDELPQLINVIRGELSFVGPRPERPEFYKILSEQIPLFSLRLLVRPGITGWAQVRQEYASSVEECKTKLEYDFYYIQNMSPRLDLHVLINTAALMIRGNSGR